MEAANDTCQGASLGAEYIETVDLSCLTCFCLHMTAYTILLSLTVSFHSDRISDRIDVVVLTDMWKTRMSEFQ